MIEISIPGVEEKTKNTKDLIFNILILEHPLSMIELTKKIRKSYNLSITYQAVRKAVNSLTFHKILSKKNKKYELNKEWILKLKNLFDKFLLEYEGGKKAYIFTQNQANEDYAIYTFNNLFDLDNFWGDVMRQWANNTKFNEPKETVGVFHYSFWFLINLGRETEMFHQFTKKGIKMYMISFNDFPLNRWGVKTYNELGIKSRVKRDDESKEGMDITIMGDTIIQVNYPSEIISKLRNFYKKYKNPQEMNLKEIAEIVHEPCEIKFMIFKNPAIAKNLREKYKRLLR
ncbi:MAG: hypothetical protein PHG05_03110 [Candidatus Nanoarchaeia archaeon]|nr:hypothetical protein [Candidatus Nanoarchaeia archaeon]